MSVETVPGVRLLSRKDLAQEGIRFSNTHLIELERRGAFPRRLNLSPAKVAWLEHEIRQWVQSRAQARPQSS